MFRFPLVLVVTLVASLIGSALAVASNEIVIVGLDTNRVCSGQVEVAVDLRVPNRDRIAGVNILIDDGEGYVRAENDSLPLPSRIVGYWDTTEVSNGWHTIQAFAQYPDPVMEGAGGHSEYSSQVVRVKTFNSITFPNMLSTYGTSVGIRAVSAIATAQWKVTVSTLSNQVLRVLTGTTTNGAIETVWDGKDVNGVRVNPEAVHIEVETVSTADEERR